MSDLCALCHCEKHEHLPAFIDPKRPCEVRVLITPSNYLAKDRYEPCGCPGFEPMTEDDQEVPPAVSNTSASPTNRQWLQRLFSGQPHQIIGAPEDPYLLRWYLIPRNPVLNVYLHKFLRDDDDRALHDHPWWFITAILRGGYIEHTESAERRMVLRCRSSVFDVRSPWWRRSIAYRPATWTHRVALPHTPDGGRVPCWTLIITGRRTREWGFWCPRLGIGGTPNWRVPKRFVPWRQFDAAGCGETS